MISNNHSSPLKQILIVDDESTSLSLLTRILEGTFSVFSAQNVDDAKRVLKAEKISIILSDIHMPGSNGFELLRFSKKEFRDIPLIFVTGVGNKEIAIEALKLGAYDFVEKPLHKQELLFSINRALEIFDARQKELETEKFLRLLEAGIESASDAFMMGSIDESQETCTIEFVNKALTKQMGYPAKDLVGESPEIFQGVDSDPLLVQKLVSSVAVGNAYSGETLNYRKNGTTYFSEWQVSPIDISFASRKFWVCMVHDIKQRKIIEERLRITEGEIKSLKGNLQFNNLSRGSCFKDIVTQDVKMIGLFHYLEAIKNSRLPVLIQGEPGVGKNLLAQAAYQCFEAKGNFVKIKCADLEQADPSGTLFSVSSDPEDALPSGSLLKKAMNGVVFLDEIADLTPEYQANLLRLLQELEYYPLKKQAVAHNFFRIIVATSHKLETLVEAGQFRADLYYKLSHHQIDVPPLRERMDDFGLLVELFLSQASKEFKKNKPSYPKELITLLSTYYFPDNVNGLRQMIYHAVEVHKRGILSMDSFNRSIKHHTSISVLKREKGVVSLEKKEKLITFSSKLPTLKEVTNELILEALRRSQDNQGIAAKILGMSRQALNKRLNRIEDVSDDEVI